MTAEVAWFYHFPLADIESMTAEDLIWWHDHARAINESNQ